MEFDFAWAEIRYQIRLDIVGFIQKIFGENG